MERIVAALTWKDHVLPVHQPGGPGDVVQSARLSASVASTMEAAASSSNVEGKKKRKDKEYKLPEEKVRDDEGTLEEEEKLEQEDVGKEMSARGGGQLAD